MASNVIQSFLVGLGFTVDTGSMRAAQNAAKRVEETIRRSDQARTRSAAEQLMERARVALKAQGIEGAGMAVIRRKAQEIEAEETASTKRRSERVVQLQRLAGRTVSAVRVVGQAVIASTLAVEAAAVSISKVAQVAAERLEAMAYSSDRTRSSVASLKAFSAAVAQLGGTAGGALNDLEAFAYKLRENPQGYTAFLKTVGVNARDAKGNIRGAVELYKEFRAEVGKKSYETQLQYMAEMGVSEQTWRATDPAKLAEQERIQRDRYSRMKFDPDAAKDDAIKLQQSYRGLMDTFGVIGEKATSAIFKQVGPNIERLTGFLEKNGDKIADVMAKVAQVVLAVAQALLELATSDTVQGFLGWLLKSFGDVDKGSGQWVANIDKIKLAMEALAVFIAGVFVAKIKGAIAETMGSLAPFLKLVAPFLGVLGFGGSIAGISIGSDLGTPNAAKPGVITQSDDENTGGADASGAIGALKRGYGAVKRTVGKLFGVGAEAKEGPSPSARTFGARTPQEAFGKDVDISQLPAGMQNNNPGNLKYFNKDQAGRYPGVVGPSQNKDEGDPQIVFNSPEAGMAAMAQRIREKYGEGRDTVRKLISDQGGWTPGKTASAENVARMMGIGVNDRVDLTDSGQMQKYMRALMRQEHGQSSKLYSDDMLRNAIAGGGGATERRGIVGSANHMKGQYGAPGENLTQITAPSGKKVAVHKEAAEAFKGFLGDLEASGYDISRLEGYSPRNQVNGSGRVSQHAYGNAIDINPAQNPYSKDFKTDLPANVSEMAKKWGLSWGGDWKSIKDTMHFEWAGVRPWLGDKREPVQGPENAPKPNPFGLNGNRLEQLEKSRGGSEAASRLGEAVDRLRENAGAMAARVGDAASRLDPDRMGAIGKATEGFNPRDYFKAPALGESTTTNSSTKNVSFNQGASSTTINNYGKSQDGMDMHERHRRRMMADDVRYASSVYASV